LGDGLIVVCYKWIRVTSVGVREMRAQASLGGVFQPAL
jgi:hypothetical protein